ncbi:MAG: ribonuclease HII [Bacteroidales bacterium]|jgi:ribonuclease HII|nr:ribonuclease HII [Bacteroidales bacterium]
MKPFFQEKWIEAGCDEAGRGCLAGPVFAAAVILPKDFTHNILTDSKQLTASQRYLLREEIEATAIAWAVASCSHQEIDRLNILRASIFAMHRAIDRLQQRPEWLLIDGNRFIPYPGIRHKCIVKGDAEYYAIAAASVLAKTYRDDCMISLSEEYPQYGWNKNKGYPSKEHRDAIARYGLSPFHRKSFRLESKPPEIPFDLE